MVIVSEVVKLFTITENVFVLERREIVGLYDADTMPFSVNDIAELIPADLDRLPVFKTEKWLRLDGIGTAAAS